MFEFNGKTGELWKDGRLIKLQPQPARLLALLVNHAGEVVERDEIQRTIWGTEILVDYELGVNRCIRQIRGALLDNADAPIYIQTVARKGYRFVAPVQKHEIEPANGHHPGVVPETMANLAPAIVKAAVHRPRIFRPYLLAVSIVSATAALIAGYEYKNRSHLPSNFEIVPLASYLGYEYSPSFSPDERQVAFTWNGERQSNFDIYVKQAGSPRLLRLTTDPAIDYSPAWSPDGRWIAFCRGTEKPGGALWLIPALGGPERKILDLDEIADPTNRPISWSPNSKSLVLASPIAPRGKSGLRLVDVFTGKIRQLTFPAPGEDDSYPSFSPQGNQIAFTRDSGKGYSSVYLLPFVGNPSSAPKPERLDWPEFQDSAYGHTAWTPRDGGLVFESTRGGPHRLWIAFARQNSQPKVLSSLGENLSGAVVSSTGRLAYVHSNFNSNVWRIKVQGLGEDGRAPMPIRTLASTRDDESPAVSPDGQKLAFASDRSGFTEIWVSNIDGSDPMQVTFLQHLAGSPAWSSDGQHILFDSRHQGDAHLYSVPVGGGEPKAICPGSGVLPLASPDGKWIYFSSRASGSLQIWRIPQSGGPAEQITTLGGFGVKLSPDCRFAYYTRSNTGISSLWQLDLAGRRERLIAPSVYLRAFVPDVAAVYYFSGDPFGSRSLNRFDLQTGTTQYRFTAGQVDGRGIALSPDGRWLFYGELDRSNSDLRLVENFWN